MTPNAIEKFQEGQGFRDWAELSFKSGTLHDFGDTLESYTSIFSIITSITVLVVPFPALGYC